MITKSNPKNLNQAPAPDNRGLAKESPENVDDEAAKSNRDVGALEERYYNKVENERHKSTAGKK